MSDVMPDIISDAIPGTTPNAISDERPKRVSFHTLGCKLNFSESSTLARQFAEGGFERCSRAADADVCVVNTCSVTGQADKKCRNLIRRIASENPGAIIAVTGCYAQLRPDDIAAIDGVDIVVGNDAKGELYSKVAAMIAARNSSAKGSDSKKTDSKKTDAENTEDATRGAKNTGEKNHAAATHGCDSLPPTSFFAAFSSGDRTRAFLKVQDGCSYKCSYCTIPYARGESRSLSSPDLSKRETGWGV